MILQANEKYFIEQICTRNEINYEYKDLQNIIIIYEIICAYFFFREKKILQTFRLRLVT